MDDTFATLTERLWSGEIVKICRVDDVSQLMGDFANTRLYMYLPTETLGKPMSYCPLFVFWDKDLIVCATELQAIEAQALARAGEI